MDEASQQGPASPPAETAPARETPAGQETGPDAAAGPGRDLPESPHGREPWRDLPEPTLRLRLRGWRLANATRIQAVGRALTWALIVVCALLMLARLAGWDAVSPLAQLVAFTPYAVPVLLLAAWLGALAGRRLAAAVAGALLLVQVAWLVPRFTAEDPPAQAGVARLRVLAANLRLGRVPADELVRLVREQRPDVLALVEITPDLEARLGELRALYPYRISRAEPGASGMALYTRQRPSGQGELSGRLAAMPYVDLAVAGRLVRVQAVHTMPPLPSTVAGWRADLGRLRDAAARARGPEIMLGDFNATVDHGSFRALLDTGLRDAHEARGRGLVRTYPTDELYPPLVHLDHVLVSPEFQVADVREYDLPGGDHRAVAADLALLPGPGATTEFSAP